MSAYMLRASADVRRTLPLPFSPGRTILNVLVCGSARSRHGFRYSRSR
jgi:hypothetical protein